MKEFTKRSIPYLAATVLCLLILTLVLKLWRANLGIPFVYNGDGLLTGVSMKGVIDHGWFLHNPSLGMPTGLFFNDFPGSDFIYWALIRFMAFFTSNWAVLFNLFVLLGYPLTALTSLFVLRQLGFSAVTSIVVSLLYSFLPYHFLRSLGHVFLAVYSVVPLVFLVAVWVSSGQVAFFARKTKQNLKKTVSARWKVIASIVIVAIASSSGIYYACLSAILLGIAGVAGSLKKKEISALLTASLLVLIILAGIVLNVSPFLVYRVQHGPNPMAVERSFGESEVYALKITQLLLPVTSHRISYLATLRGKYDLSAPLVNENSMATLGLIGSLGFLFLLGWFLLARGKEIPGLSFSVYDVGLFNISFVLIGTVGGLGMAISLVMSVLRLPPALRCWNRISVYIAYFSFIAVAIGLDYIRKGLVRRGLPVVFLIIAGFVLLIGIFDQTTDAFTPNYAVTKTAYKNDENFVRMIERVTPRDSMIFQLPYTPFPEASSPGKIGFYELLRGYAHSNKLRWSYGAMKGRDDDVWQKKVSGLPVDGMMKEVAAKGFRGVYIDRFGYADGGVALERKISKVVKTKPIVSADGRLAFYKFPSYLGSQNRR